MEGASSRRVIRGALRPERETVCSEASKHRMDPRASVRWVVGCVASIVFANCGATTNGHPDVAMTDDSSAMSDVAIDGPHPLASPGDTLPCAVATVLARDCTGCHFTGSTLAPSSLLSRADLMSPSTTDPMRTVAQVSIQRMMDSANPMPPLPAAGEPATTIAAFQQWVDSGLSMGSCMLPDPLSDPSMCPSNSFWTRGNQGSSDMHPGVACIACHTTMNRGPRPTAAGTVYPTGHAPDDCNAFTAGSPIPSNVDVELTDSTGRVVHISPSATGNFVLIALGFTLPYTARVVYMGRERRMATPQTDGDCNGCHTQSGANSAPGRITMP